MSTKVHGNDRPLVVLGQGEYKREYPPGSGGVQRTPRSDEYRIGKMRGTLDEGRVRVDSDSLTPFVSCAVDLAVLREMIALLQAIADDAGV